MLGGMDNDFQWHTRPNDLCCVCACESVSIIVLYEVVK